MIPSKKRKFVMEIVKKSKKLQKKFAKKGLLYFRKLRRVRKKLLSKIRSTFYPYKKGPKNKLATLSLVVFLLTFFVFGWHVFLGNVVKNFAYSLNPNNAKVNILLDKGGKTKEITAYATKDEQKNTYNLNLSADSATIQLKDISEKPKELSLSVRQPSKQDSQIKTDIVYVSDAPSFGVATITLKKPRNTRINAILYCPEWAYEKESSACRNWEITDINPQNFPTEITFQTTHFSAYAGAYLEILNVQTNLTKGNDWITYFKAYSQSDLTIEPAAGTIYGRDIEFKGFYCGDERIDGAFDGNKVYIKDYICENKTSRIENRALTGGKHTLKFTFANTIYYAKNFACDSGSLNNPGDICYISTTQYFDEPDSISGTGTLYIISGGNLAPTTTATSAIIDITVTEDIIINATNSAAGTITVNFQSTSTNFTISNSSSSVNVNGKGYAGGTGQVNGNPSGAGGGNYDSKSNSTNVATYSGGGGAGHGGTGGAGYNIATGGISYGSSTQPTFLGAGGGGSYSFNSYGTDCSASASGGSGGGSVKLNVLGTITINGIISAGGNTGNYKMEAMTQNCYAYGGSGSGGSIWITAATTTGNGTTSANGANGYNNSYPGGGAGGRIAIYATSSEYTGPITAYGGTGYGYEGGAGTIYKKLSSDTYGDLIIDNNSQSGTTTKISDADFTVKNLTVGSGANLKIESGSVFNLASTSLVVSGTITNSGTFNATTALWFAGGTITNEGTFNFDNLTSATGTISNSGTLNFATTSPITLSGTTTNSGTINGANAALALTGGTITNSGTVTFDSLSSATGTISNSGTFDFNSFGSATFDASTTNSGTTTFDSLPATLTFTRSISNSGILNLATTTLTISSNITNSGTINGTSTTLVLSGTTVTNTGRFNFDILSSATGTINNSGTFDFNSFGSATFDASTTNSGTTTFDSVPATFTFTRDISNSGYLLLSGVTDLTIATSTTFTVNTFLATTTYLPNLQNLTVNGTLSHQSNTSSKVNYIDLTLQNLTINESGSINVSGKGHSGGYSTNNGNISGQGGGTYGYYSVLSVGVTIYAGGGGGGHGGAGGTGYGPSGGSGTGGIAKGSTTEPVLLGSGGGGGRANNTMYGTNAYATGGSGGGGVKLNILNTINISGSINAAGTAGNSSSSSYCIAYGGGGSGGVFGLQLRPQQGTEQHQPTAETGVMPLMRVAVPAGE